MCADRAGMAVRVDKSHKSQRQHLRTLTPLRHSASLGSPALCGRSKADMASAPRASLKSALPMTRSPRGSSALRWLSRFGCAPACKAQATSSPIGLPGPPSIPDDEFRPNLPKKGLQPSDDNAATYPVNGPNLIRNGEFEEFDRQEDGAANWVHWVPQGSEHKRVAGQGIDGSAAFLIRNERLFSDSQSVMTQQINYTGDSPRIRFTPRWDPRSAIAPRCIVFSSRLVKPA